MWNFLVACVNYPFIWARAHFEGNARRIIVDAIRLIIVFVPTFVLAMGFEKDIFGLSIGLGPYPYAFGIFGILCMIFAAKATYHLAYMYTVSVTHLKFWEAVFKIPSEGIVQFFDEVEGLIESELAKIEPKLRFLVLIEWLIGFSCMLFVLTGIDQNPIAVFWILAADAFIVMALVVSHPLQVPRWSIKSNIWIAIGLVALCLLLLFGFQFKGTTFIVWNASYVFPIITAFVLVFVQWFPQWKGVWFSVSSIVWFVSFMSLWQYDHINRWRMDWNETTELPRKTITVVYETIGLDENLRPIKLTSDLYGQQAGDTLRYQKNDVLRRTEDPFYRDEKGNKYWWITGREVERGYVNPREPVVLVRDVDVWYEKEESDGRSSSPKPDFPETADDMERIGPADVPDPGWERSRKAVFVYDRGGAPSYIEPQVFIRPPIKGKMNITTKHGEEGHYGESHYAIDIAIPVNTELYASFPGRVRRFNAGIRGRKVNRLFLISFQPITTKNWGNVNLMAEYVDVGLMFAADGDTVRVGQKIALSSGINGTGPHLHYALHLVDPNVIDKETGLPKVLFTPNPEHWFKRAAPSVHAAIAYKLFQLPPGFPNKAGKVVMSRREMAIYVPVRTSRGDSMILTVAREPKLKVRYSNDFYRNPLQAVNRKTFGLHGLDDEVEGVRKLRNECNMGTFSANVGALVYGLFSIPRMTEQIVRGEGTLLGQVEPTTKIKITQNDLYLVLAYNLPIGWRDSTAGIPDQSLKLYGIPAIVKLEIWRDGKKVPLKKRLAYITST
jgi:murein DD-endopeptidase MepM/ murein hydrolase activator NlpD